MLQARAVSRERDCLAMNVCDYENNSIKCVRDGYARRDSHSAGSAQTPGSRRGGSQGVRRACEACVRDATQGTREPACALDLVAPYLLGEGSEVGAVGQQRAVAAHRHARYAYATSTDLIGDGMKERGRRAPRGQWERQWQYGNGQVFLMAKDTQKCGDRSSSRVLRLMCNELRRFQKSRVSERRDR